jgi:glycosyltransferase involved in cell wall biosynthesis
MLKRAEKYADAIVVPSHAVAVQLDEVFGFGDRLRVIPGAPSRSLRTPADADERAETLGLPDRYILTVADTSQRKGLASLLEALRDEPVPVVIAAGSDADAVREAAAGIDGVTVFGPLDDADLGTVYDRAALYVQPSLAEGFGLAVLEALDHGIPVVHTDDPALVETTSGAAIVVPREGDEPLADRLGAAVRAVLDRPDARTRLSVAATDRASAFSWRDSADRVWQLHADL